MYAAVGYKHFVVIVTSYNNEKWVAKNLHSIFRQTYPHYRVIYVDDASTDRTVAIAQVMIKKHHQDSRVTLIKNECWQGQMANHYRAAHMCRDDEIIIHLDGDDQLVGQVFDTLNTIYADENIWFTFGQNDLQTDRPFEKEVLQNNTFRTVSPPFFTHLRTFYAWLFKQVKLQDLMFESNFKSATPSPDMAFMYPIAEMAGYHHKFIETILYSWNMQNPISQTKVNREPQFKMVAEICSFEKYAPLLESKCHYMDQFKNRTADIILFVSSEQSGKTALDSIHHSIKNYNAILVVPLYDNKQTLSDMLGRAFAAAGDHIMFMIDDIQMEQKIDLSECIWQLERTFAFGFYFDQRLQDDMPPCAYIEQNMYAWQFRYGNFRWNEPARFNELFTPAHSLIKQDSIGSEWTHKYTLTTALYRKSDIQNVFDQLDFASWVSFKNSFYRLNDNLNRSVGLFLK